MKTSIFLRLCTRIVVNLALFGKYYIKIKCPVDIFSVCLNISKQMYCSVSVYFLSPCCVFILILIQTQWEKDKKVKVRRTEVMFWQLKNCHVSLIALKFFLKLNTFKVHWRMRELPPDPGGWPPDINFANYSSTKPLNGTNHIFINNMSTKTCTVRPRLTKNHWENSIECLIPP